MIKIFKLIIMWMNITVQYKNIKNIFDIFYKIIFSITFLFSILNA